MESLFTVQIVGSLVAVFGVAFYTGLLPVGSQVKVGCVVSITALYVVWVQHYIPGLQAGLPINHPAVLTLFVHVAICFAIGALGVWLTDRKAFT